MFGILIVTYNSEEVIGGCLDSCRNAGAEVVVIDNASTDRTTAEVLARPWVHFVRNETNRGFAGAVNQGFRFLKSTYVLLLNPDTEITTDLKPLVECFLDASVGAAAGRLTGTDGHDQTKFHLRRLPSPGVLALEALGVNRLWPANPLNRRYRPANGHHEIEQPAAAFLMIRRQAWEELGGFDERFFPVWFEDVDFCKRLRDAGWRIAYTPTVVVAHSGGHSASKISWRQRQIFWYGSLLRYAAKHFSAASRLLVCAAVMLACVPRMLGGVIHRQNLEPIAVFSRVVWLATLSLLFGRAEAAGVQARSRHAVRGANAAG